MYIWVKTGKLWRPEEALFSTIHPIFWVPICAVDPC